MPQDGQVSLPVHFENPPVVETVLGVQFAPLPALTSGHFGWFWKSYLDPSWRTARDAPWLPDQFERFGDQPAAVVPLLHLVPADQPARLQISNAGDDRVIQVQRTRLLYNWRRREQAYPRHESALAEFKRHLDRFRAFAADAGLGELIPNQWELNYVNHIAQGRLWQSPADWSRILPGLLGRHTGQEGVRLESQASEWHFEIEPHRGRLHASVKHGRIRDAEVLVLQLAARGPIGGDVGQTLDAGLELGHRVIVRSFVEWTSPEAQEYWRRRSEC